MFVGTLSIYRQIYQLVLKLCAMTNASTSYEFGAIVLLKGLIDLLDNTLYSFYEE
jgi:hypothetical protein